MKQQNPQVCECCSKAIKSDKYCCLECDSQYCLLCYDDIDECLNCQEMKKRFSREFKITQLKDVSLANKVMLGELKIIQSTLIYIIGLPNQIANEEILSKPEYLGQYGHINKLIVKRNGTYNSSSNAAYVTFSNELEAALAIIGTDEFQLNHSTIKSSCGTTKYCSHFLKGQNCPKIKECVYLHQHPHKETQVLTKDDRVPSKWLSNHSIKMAKMKIKQNLKEVIQQRNKNQGKSTIFPSIGQILEHLLETQEIREQQLEEIENPKQKQNEIQRARKDVLEGIESRIIDLLNKDEPWGSRFKFVQNDQNLDIENIKVVKEYAKSLQD